MLVCGRWVGTIEHARTVEIIFEGVAIVSKCGENTWVDFKAIGHHTFGSIELHSAIHVIDKMAVVSNQSKVQTLLEGKYSWRAESVSGDPLCVVVIEDLLRCEKQAMVIGHGVSGKGREPPCG